MTKRIIVSGRVQGVGFRAFTEQAAMMLGVVGQVWNRRDGAVEAVASHPDASVLDGFVERLRRGPGYVSGVEVFEDPEREFEGFRIIDC